MKEPFRVPSPLPCSPEGPKVSPTWRLILVPCARHTILPPAHHLLPSAGPRWWEEGGTCLSPNPFSHISHISLLPKSDICAKGTWAIIYRWVLSLGREQFPKCLVATSITSCAETTLTQPAALGLRLVVKLCFLQ